MKIQVEISAEQAEALLTEALSYYGETSPKKAMQIRRKDSYRRDLIRLSILRRLPA